MLVKKIFITILQSSIESRSTEQRKNDYGKKEESGEDMWNEIRNQTA